MRNGRHWHRPCVALVALLPFAIPAVDAALYKWVDANGRTVYSDQVPPGVHAEPVRGAPPPANPDAVKDFANRDAEFRKRQLDRADEAKKAQQTQLDAQKLAASCAQLRSQVTHLRNNDVAMYKLNDKGERVFLDDAGRKVEIERLEGTLRERNCPRG